MGKLTRFVLAIVGTGALVAPFAETVGMIRRGDESRVASEKSPRGSIDGTVRYGRDVRPILSDRCFKCHGPDPKTRAAGLRLDDETLAKSEVRGAHPIVAGNLDESEVWRRINSDDPDEVMPPPTSGKRTLSPEEKEKIAAWIKSGAKYEPHWAFVPPVRAEVPVSGNLGTAVDGFVHRGLVLAGLDFSPEADRSTLCRRLFLDLTGLPPTPEEHDAFLADTAPGAYDRLVEMLLSKEPYRSRYAERMATPWLDQARYADTCGIHMDAGRSIWPWRDWLLKALRDGMPFDRFVKEQIAGDLLPNATEDQKVASGFHRNHVTTDEGGAISEEYLVEYAVDRTATTGSVFLGLTLGCARCHEHKYDPISQDEFYKFYAFFNSIEEPGLYSQLPDPKRALEPYLDVPSDATKKKLAEIGERLEKARADLDKIDPGEDARRAAFYEDLARSSRLTWHDTKVTAAKSADGGADLAIEPDGSVFASGKNPARDVHTIVLATNAESTRFLALAALADPRLPGGRVGRAPNGNAVLSRVDVVAKSIADPTQKKNVEFDWAWADFEQQNGDYKAVNLFDGAGARGWAVDGHERTGDRYALLAAKEPFGYPGGTEISVTLRYESIYAQHTFGRVKLAAGSIDDAALARLPGAASGWYLAGPFRGGRDELYDKTFGPELESTIDLSKRFGAGGRVWTFNESFVDGRVNGGTPDGSNASYVARKFFAPTARNVEVSIGSDDGFKIFVNQKEVAKGVVDRGVLPDQDKVSFRVERGMNTIVFKIVNTGGVGGFYWRMLPTQDELSGDLVAALLPTSWQTGDLAVRRDRKWRMDFSPDYRARTAAVAALEKEKTDVEGSIPKTMVMKELEKPRETYVLMRGAYDKPDKNRPITRGVPAALGKWPEGAPLDRSGLAQWLLSPENPLLARVTVNRIWELFFGTGIVKTSEDFGLQGEWPSHPELLDWLAVEFRESGWKTDDIVRLLVKSVAYRQSARVRPEAREKDPENRLLAYFPRRRLGAEEIRDQALYIAGLLVEKFGGESVKPYQPDGLWQEVAMVQSNTREYQRGMGDELWRRSLYTYWKRACPPPTLLTFDAPTREFCTTRRITTNTPLQALALWNDVQFVEAARVLAQRTIEEAKDDAQRIDRMFRRAAGRAPTAKESNALSGALATFRASRTADPEGSTKLATIGEAPKKGEIDPTELAAWTLLANAVLNLDAVVTRG